VKLATDMKMENGNEKMEMKWKWKWKWKWKLAMEVLVLLLVRFDSHPAGFPMPGLCISHPLELNSMLVHTYQEISDTQSNFSYVIIGAGVQGCWEGYQIRSCVILSILCAVLI